MTLRIPKLALVAVGAVVVGVLAATAFGAFNGGSRSTTTVASGFGPRDPAALPQQLQKFQQCLNQHGVKPPQHGVKQPGSPQGPHRPSKKARRAFQTCGQYLPQRGPSGPPPLRGVPGAPPGGFPGTPPGGFPGVPPGGFPGTRSG
jgi:hypothetical protein